MSPHPRLAFLCLCLVFACACRGLPSDPPAEIIPLTPGAIHPRSLAGGKPHTFQFDVAADRFLHLDVEQRGLDVIVRLRDPAGRLVFEIDSPGGRRGAEAVLVVTPAAGRYSLQVSPLASGAAGDFALVVRAVRPARPEDRRWATAAARLARAELQWQAGDFEPAAEGFRAGLPELERRGAAQAAAQARWRLGTSLFRQGDLRASARLLERSAAGFRAVGDGIGEARVLNSLGASWRLLGQPARALEAYRRALGLYRQAGVTDGEASALNNMGLVLRSTGDLQGAISHFEEALGLWQKMGDRSSEATTLENLGSLYIFIGHDDEGLDLLHKALALLGRKEDERARISTLIELGWAESLTGQPEKALERYREAIATARRVGDKPGETGAWDRQGTTLRNLGRREEAAASYTRALEISRATGSPRNEAHTRANLGGLALETGGLGRAEAELRRSLDLMIDLDDASGEASVRIALSRIDRRRGNPARARQQIETALQRFEELRTGLRGAASRGSFVAVRYDAWEELVSLLMELGRGEEALEVAERARARILLDQMAGGALDQMAGGDGEAAGGAGLRRRSELQAEIQAMDERRRSLAVRNPEDPRLPLLMSALRERSLELDRLALPAVARPGPASLTARQIQGLADEGTLLVVYLLAEPASFAWTVDRERIVSHVLPGRQTIETLARRLAAALPRSHEHTARGAAERAARDLSQAILAPLGDRLAGRRRLVLLPDGALHLLPFAALPSPSSRHPLLVDHELAVLPSATVLVEQRRRLAGRQPAPGELAVLADPVFSPTDPRLTRLRGDPGATAGDRGDPALGFGPLARLPYTAGEADALARLVPADRRLVVTGFAATRDLATGGALRGYRRLHFATHGLLHPVLPERSGIVLSLLDEQGNPREGFLSAPDVAALDLPADLVVLSACQTGLGRELRGEGLVGLTQAFFRAGAKSVVVSSWEVRDKATATLMARFYRNLLTDRLPPAAALRQAQLSLRGEARTAAPTYWAGFSLQGDWR